MVRVNSFSSLCMRHECVFMYTTSSVILRNAVHFFWHRVLSLSWSSPIRQDWLVSGPQGSFRLHLHSSGITRAHHHTCHFYVASRNQVWSTGLTSTLLIEPFHCPWIPGVLTKPFHPEWLEFLCLSELYNSSISDTLKLRKGRSSVFIAFWSNT